MFRIQQGGCTERSLGNPLYSTLSNAQNKGVRAHFGGIQCQWYTRSGQRRHRACRTLARKRVGKRHESATRRTTAQPEQQGNPNFLFRSCHFVARHVGVLSKERTVRER